MVQMSFWCVPECWRQINNHGARNSFNIIGIFSARILPTFSHWLLLSVKRGYSTMNWVRPIPKYLRPMQQSCGKVIVTVYFTQSMLRYSNSSYTNQLSTGNVTEKHHVSCRDTTSRELMVPEIKQIKLNSKNCFHKGEPSSTI